MHITQHAIERFQERVEPCPDEQARAALLAVAAKAAAFAGLVECFVRLSGGQRVCIRDGSVVTVLPSENYKTHVRRIGRGRYG